MDWELNLMKWAAGWWSSPILDQVVPWLTHLGSHLAVIPFILVNWILSRRARVLRSLIFLYAVQSAITYGLKYFIQRPRPPSVLETAFRLSKGPGEILDPSFPSAHTVYAFMMATLLSQKFPRYKVAFYVLAGMIGWTRIYLGLHYPTDVIAGALLGYGITKLLFHSFRLDFKNSNKKVRNS
jgi:undecaprenyl-diphosphatase